MITKIKDKKIFHNEILKILDFKEFNDKKNEILMDYRIFKKHLMKQVQIYKIKLKK